MVFLAGLIGWVRAVIVIGVLLCIGTVVVRPEWFGLINTQNPVTIVEPQSETIFVDTINSGEVMFDSPIKQSTTQPDEQMPEFDLIIANLDFTQTTLGTNECKVMGGDIVDDNNNTIHAQEFLHFANQFVFGEYTYDSYSPTPIVWWVQTINPFCPSWDLQQMKGMYSHYDNELIANKDTYTPNSTPVIEYRELPLPEFISQKGQ